MMKMQFYAILALGFLMALVASEQTTGQAATLDGAEEMIPQPTVTIVEPFGGYGMMSLDELSVALSMPAGPQPWDLGEIAPWQQPTAQDVYGEPVTVIDEGQALVGLIDMPAEDQGQGQLAAVQPQELPTEPFTPSAGPRPVVPAAPAMSYEVSPYATPGAVYATTADYSCQPPMYAPVYSDYYYAYPYANYYAPSYYDPYAYYPYGAYDPYYGMYAGYYGHYGYYDPFLYPYGGYYGSFSIFPSFDFHSHFRHHSFFRGDGDHDRDDFLFRHSRSGLFAHGSASIGHSFAAGAAIRPWRPGVSSTFAAAHTGSGRNFSLSTDRSLLGRRGPIDLNRGAFGTAGGLGSARAAALPRTGRSLTAGPTVQAAPAIGSHGSTLGASPRTANSATALGGLQQRRDAYMDVLRGRNAGAGNTAQSLSAGGAASAGLRTRSGFGAGSGNLSRRSSGPNIDAAVNAQHEVMRDSLLRRLNAMPGATGTAAGPARQYSTFQPQVAPQQQFSPGASVPVGPRSLTARSLTANSLTPRTLSAPAATPGVTISPRPLTTSTVPTPGMRFSSSTWPHNSTAAPDATPLRTFTPRTVGPSEAATNAAAAPSYTPRTFTPRAVGPSQAAPTVTPPASYYTPRTFTPRTAAPSDAAPSYTPRTFTPRTAAPIEAAPSNTPRTFTPRAVGPSAESFSRSAPSYSRFTPSARESSAPAMSAAPTRSYTPAASPRSSEYTSPRWAGSSRESAGPSRRR